MSEEPSIGILSRISIDLNSEQGYEASSTMFSGEDTLDTSCSQSFLSTDARDALDSLEKVMENASSEQHGRTIDTSSEQDILKVILLLIN